MFYTSLTLGWLDKAGAKAYIRTRLIMFKNLARCCCYLWMVLVLNTMFQLCFQWTDGQADPINSLSELVMEEFLGMEDALVDDEHADHDRKLKTPSLLVWHCSDLKSEIRFNLPQPLKRVAHNGAVIPNDLKSEVLIPPPDVQPA